MDTLSIDLHDATPEDWPFLLSAIAALNDHERALHDTRLPGAEIAEAAALGDLVAAMSVLARLVPAGGIGVLLTAFPMAVLGHRRRARVCAISVTTASHGALFRFAAT